MIEITFDDVKLTKPGHSFTNYVSNNDATCTENGTETAKCDNCDESDTREEANSALGNYHSGDWQINDEEHWKVCKRDGSNEIFDKSVHKYDNGVITTPATEEKEGEKTYTCEDCKHTKKEPIEKLEKTYPALPSVKAAAGDEKITLSWNKISDAAKYRVFYRLNGASAWNYKETTETSYTVSGLTGGKKYDFLVLAYNGSKWSK